MRERISVIIAAYQHEAFIAQCIESVLEQQIDADLEILIGEDASADDTLAVCQRYASDPRVTIIARAPSARKIKIEGYLTGRANMLDLMARATGDFVIRIDGDDRWCDRHKLHKQLDVLRGEPTAMGCYHQTERMEEDGRATGLPFRAQLADRMAYPDTIAPLSPFHVSSFIYRNTPAMRRPPNLAWQVGSLDLLVFSMAAHQGLLIQAEGTMSMYRLHGQGLSKRGLFARSNNLRLRILLWTGLVAMYRGAGRSKAHEVCDDHLQAALNEEIDRRDARFWAKAVLQRPAYFLGRPHRIRTVLRIIRKGFRR